MRFEPSDESFTFLGTSSQQSGDEVIVKGFPVLEEANQPTLTEWAYDQLLNALISGTFLPEQKLTVGKLAQQLGLSPTPVKQAMSRLVGEGFIRFVPRHGFFLNPVSLKYLDEVYDARLMCELYAIQFLSPGPDPHLITELEQLACKCDQCFKAGGSPKEFLQVDQQFHLRIVQLADNSVIEKWFQRLAVHRWEMYFRLHQDRGSYGSRHKSTEEHYAIIEAIAAGYIEQASAQIRKHIENTKQHLFELVKSSSIQHT